MKRIGLVEFGNFKITEDTKKAVQLLIVRAKNFGWIVGLCETPISTEMGALGREVCFEMRHNGEYDTSTQDKVNALWGVSSAIGFHPLQ